MAKPNLSIKERLMAYPKEVLIDYFLNNVLIWQFDWKWLDFQTSQRQMKVLLEKSRQLIEQSRNARGSKFWAIQDELDALSKRMEKLNRVQERCLGLDKKKRPVVEELDHLEVGDAS